MEASWSRRAVVAAAGAAVVLGGCGGSDPEPPGRRSAEPTAAADLAILGFAVTLEYFTAGFYERLIADRVLEDDDSEIVAGLRDDEEQHVDALEGLVEKLGGRRPEPPPPPNFERLLGGGPDAILARAAELENVGAAAYLGQVTRVQDAEVLETLLAIHSVEGRHAAGLDHRAGRSFVPDSALASPLDARQARARLVGLGL